MAGTGHTVSAISFPKKQVPSCKMHHRTLRVANESALLALAIVSSIINHILQGHVIIVSANGARTRGKSIPKSKPDSFGKYYDVWPERQPRSTILSPLQSLYDNPDRRTERCLDVNRNVLNTYRALALIFAVLALSFAFIIAYSFDALGKLEVPPRKRSLHHRKIIVE